MRNYTFKLLILPIVALLSACSFNNVSSIDQEESFDSTSYSIDDTSKEKESELSITPISDISSIDGSKENQEISKITDLNIDGITYSDNKFLITKEGEYTFTGDYLGIIEVNAPEQEVTLILNDFTISSSVNSPILCWDAESLKIKIKNGTTNYVYDNREPNPDEEDENGNIGKGAIYSKCDTKFSGKGNLFVVGKYNNGIHSTKDLKFDHTPNNGSKIQVVAYNNAIKGNDSLTINNGNIIAISSGGDGLKTVDNDISSKGNQRGNIEIYGGNINIYSCCDAIDAAYNVIIDESINSEINEKLVPTVFIHTSNYSEYSVEKVPSSTSTMYLRTTNRSNSLRYALLFTDSSGNESWSDASYSNSSTSGRTTYYFYKLDVPKNAVSFYVYAFSNSSLVNDVDNASAKTSRSQNINSSFDTLPISVSGSNITTSSWTTRQTSNQGGWGGWGQSQGNQDKADYSAKGIKAKNKISISSGNLDIKTYDDGIHAVYNELLDNGEYGLGNVEIKGGSIDIYASDDGVHADNRLDIFGGDINITNSYEGLEANIINIEGGNILIYSTDDGLNAANKAGISPQIYVKGGLIDITTYGNDIDGIDSNGSFAQSGGIIITKGGTGNMSTGLDTDGSASISGGTLICFGRPEKTPTTSNVTSKTFQGSYPIGTYRITNESIDLTTTTRYSYTTIYVYTDGDIDFTFTKI